MLIYPLISLVEILCTYILIFCILCVLRGRPLGVTGSSFFKRFIGIDFGANANDTDRIEYAYEVFEG